MIKVGCGKTVRAEVQFKGWDKLPTDPDSINFVVKNHSYTVIYGPVLLNQSHRLDVGKYRVEYTLPSTEGVCVLEFVAFLEGSQDVVRTFIMASMLSEV